MRPDREDTATQEAAVEKAREALAAALDGLEMEARAAARVLRRKSLRGNVDLTPVHTEVRTVSRAEEALDLALLDLHTARGEDA